MGKMVYGKEAMDIINKRRKELGIDSFHCIVDEETQKKFDSMPIIFVNEDEKSE